MDFFLPSLIEVGTLGGLMLSSIRVSSSKLLVSYPIEVGMNGLLSALFDRGRHFGLERCFRGGAEDLEVIVLG